MNRTTIAVVGATLLCGACGDGQAGSEYRGEPLMTLRAALVSEEVPLVGELVPAFKFGDQDFGDSFGNPSGHNPFHSSDSSHHYVKSEVDGVFPSEFIMRVYDPPPAEVLRAQSPGEPAFVAGAFVAVDVAHPDRLDARSVEVTGTTPTAWEAEVCSDRGQCLRGAADHCDLPGNGFPFVAGNWPCGGTFPPGFPWTEYGHSDNYAVIYFAAAMPAGGLMSRVLAGGEAIPAGYHLLRPTAPDPSRQRCTDEEFNATYDVALLALKQMYNLDPNDTDWSSKVPDSAAQELQTQYLLALDANGCTAGWEFVETTSRPVTVSLVTSTPLLPF